MKMAGQAKDVDHGLCALILGLETTWNVEILWLLGRKLEGPTYCQGNFDLKKINVGITILDF